MKIQISQTKIGDLENTLPKDLYSSQLQVINGISFTPREIDIIACILSGRAMKRIASLLIISPKTVENHIRNVMKKLDCSSQQNIIDFVEKSGKFSFIKKYYLNLLILARFELELRRIASLKNGDEIGCLINYQEERNVPESLIVYLEKHLKFAGVKVFKEIRENHETLTEEELASKTGQGIIKHVIYYFPDKSNPALLHSNIDEKIEKNYYFLCFEILNQLFSKRIEKNIHDFKKEYFLLNAGVLDDNNSLSAISGFEELSKKMLKIALTKKMAIGIGSVIFLGLSYVVFLTFVFIKNENVVDPRQINPGDILNSEAKRGPSKSQCKSENFITWNLPRQDHVFVGREKLLDELHNQLAPPAMVSNGSLNQVVDKESTALRTSVNAGLGGIGKTQVALQFIRHTKHSYHLKAWFPSENLDALRQKYIEFAKYLGLKKVNPTFPEVTEYIKKWLGNHPGWLLVYDNVTSYEEIRPFLPENGGSIILTTRTQFWPSKFKIISLDVMSENEALELLKTIVNRNIDDKEKISALELLKILGNLPLAIAQASAYIQQNQISIAQYLELYKQYENDLLANNILPLGTISLPVMNTWDITLAAISDKSKDYNEPFIVRDLLMACAYLAPEKIPREYLLTWLKTSYPHLSSPELKLSTLINQLRQYSIIQIDENKDISLHRLLQTVLRYQHKSNFIRSSSIYPALSKAWYDTLLKAIHTEFNRNTEVLEKEARQKHLLPHLQMLLTHFKKTWPDVSELSVVDIINDIGSAFYLMKERVAVSYYQRSLLTLEKHYGMHDIKIAYTLGRLANSYRTLGEVQRAKELNHRALIITEQFYGKSHIEVAIILNQLGRDYRYLGNPKKAKEFHEQALKISEKAYKKNDVEMAFILEQLGRDCCELGEIIRAKELQERALEIKEKNYGKDHFEIAYTLDSIGRVYRHLGNIKRAIELHLRSLKIKEQFYGINHVSTASTLDQLGTDYSNFHNGGKAITYHTRALKLKEEYYGKDHFEFAATLVHLGMDHEALGNFKQAREFYESALIIEKLHYGENSLPVAKTSARLGGIYTALSNAEQGKTYLLQSLEIMEKFYGRNHPRIAETFVKLANTYKILGDTKQADLQIEKARKIRESIITRE